MRDTIIKIENARKKFGNQTVLNDISVDIERGKIYGFVGRNGSGKTVLFKSICGFVILDEGQIQVEGKIVGKDIDMPDNIGLIIETPGFLKDYSAFWNLKFLAKLRGKIDDERIKESIRMVGLNPDDKKKVGKFSLGMRQRLGIAQAIMEEPDILILDEPFNGLDKNGVEEMRKLLLKLNKDGKTIIMASHSAEDIKILCTEVYEMDAGVCRYVRGEKNGN